jgi:uncharacterized protein YoxC
MSAVIKIVVMVALMFPIIGLSQVVLDTTETRYNLVKDVGVSVKEVSEYNDGRKVTEERMVLLSELDGELDRLGETVERLEMELEMIDLEEEYLKKRKQQIHKDIRINKRRINMLRNLTKEKLR